MEILESLEKQKKSVEDQLQQINNAIKAEKKRIEDQVSPDIIEIADALHEKMCRSDHTEHCDWYYGSWEKKTSAHMQYIGKAERLKEKFNSCISGPGISPAKILIDIIKEL